MCSILHVVLISAEIMLNARHSTFTKYSLSRGLIGNREPHLCRRLSGCVEITSPTYHLQE